MTIRALRTLIAIYQNGSFRAAAEAEHLTPSAISHQMKNLEQSLGFDIFDRSPKQPVLNAKGLALVGRAELIVSEYDCLGVDLASQDDLSGELVLGAVPTTLTGLVPIALAGLREKHPSLTVRLVPGLTNDLLLQLDRGLIQAAVVSRPEVLPPKLRFTEIVTEQLLLLTSNQEQSSDPIELLRNRPFIRFTRDAVVGKIIEGWLQKHDICVSEVMELAGLDAISSMVVNGLGVSIVPKSLEDQRRDLPLRWTPLEEDGPARTIGVASRNASIGHKVLDALCAELGNAGRYRNNCKP